MKLGLLHVHFLYKIIDYIRELLDKLNIGVLCKTETYLFESELSITHVAMSKTSSIICVASPHRDHLSCVKQLCTLLH